MSDLSDSTIIQRRSAYAGCALDAAYASVDACIYGDTKCADYNYALAVYYQWAKNVAERTNTSTETCGCVTQDFAKQVFAQADPLCVHCACDAAPVNPVVPVYPCNITPDATVPFAYDAALYNVLFTGQVYVTGNVAGVSNPWASHVGAIMENSAVETNVPTGWIIYAQNQADYWVQTPTGPGAYWPLPLLSVVDSTTIQIESQWPNSNAYQGFNTKIEVYVDDAWVTVYEGADPLATPQDYTVADSSLVTAVRITYSTVNCTYGPFTGVAGVHSHDVGISHDESHG